MDEATPDAILASIERDVEEERAKVARAREGGNAVWDEIESLHQEERSLFPNGADEPTDPERYAELGQRHQTLIERWQGFQGAEASAEAQIKRLESPHEYDRRAETMSRIGRLRKETGMASKTKTPQACECGCGAMTTGGRFLPGHDAKLKSQLVTAAVNGDKKAEDRLEKLGWTSWLEKRRNVIAKKDEAAAKRAEAKEAKTRAAAEAKAAKAQAKQQKTTVAKAEQAGTLNIATGEIQMDPEVKPDPKPAKRSGTRQSGTRSRSTRAKK